MLHIIELTVPLLMQGILTTIEVSALAILFAAIIGFLAGAGHMSSNEIIKKLVAVYIKLFRCTPFMVQIYIVYYGLPTFGVRLPAFWAGAIVLGLYTGAYVAVILESGIKSLPKGQEEAAVAMGMPYFMRLRRILFPQTISIIIPPLTGQFIQTVKDSSVLSVITVSELTMMTKEAIGITFSPIQVYLCTAMFYWILNLVIEYFSKRIERKSYVRRSVIG